MQVTFQWQSITFVCDSCNQSSMLGMDAQCYKCMVCYDPYKQRPFTKKVFAPYIAGQPPAELEVANVQELMISYNDLCRQEGYY